MMAAGPKRTTSEQHSKHLATQGLVERRVQWAASVAPPPIGHSLALGTFNHNSQEITMAGQRPSTEINDVAPTSLSHLVGQRGVVDQVAVAIEAAFADGKKMDHCLLVGGPGL